MQPRLLIVDDVEDNRVLLSRRFARRGYATVEVDSGQGALDRLKIEPFDAVLLDIMMPGLDGMSVLRIIRETWSPFQLPVILVTARADSETLVEALRCQANDYITKPVIFEVALARVGFHVGMKRAREELTQTVTALEVANHDLKSMTHGLIVANEQLRHQTYHDSLTELPNRRWLSEQLSASLGRDHSVAALLLLDLDGFKGVNDTLGHSAGDAFLQELSADLGDILRAGEQIARLGGDEFAVLAPTASDEELEDLARRLIEVAARRRYIQGHEVALGASVGIARAQATDTPEALLKAADISMYEAKARGRGTHAFFEPWMNQRIIDRQEMLKDLQGALERNEFALYYQPYISASDRAVTGYEALLRWEHPLRGMIGPAEFIPLAEETGLIVSIGAWVLRQACRQATALPDEQRISVNVSPIQFRRPGFDMTVLSAIMASGIRPGRIEIEITEAIVINDSADTLGTIQRLKEIGVRLALDDFGIGYSSLSYLRKFPFDKLKIDRSFVQELGPNAESEAIVRAICRMADALGMTVTAEGIETQAQADTLIDAGCVELQGFLYSRPVPHHRLPLGAAAMGAVTAA